MREAKPSRGDVCVFACETVVFSHRANSRRESRLRLTRLGSESFCKVPLAILAVLWYNKKKGAAFPVSILQKENVK